MKILMIAPEPFFEPRGTPFSEYFRIRALGELGHEIDLATYPLGQDVQLRGLRIYRTVKVPFIHKVKVGPSIGKLILDFFLFFTVLRLLFQNRYECIHTHEEACFMGGVLSRLCKIPHVYDMHSSLPQQFANFDITRSNWIHRILEAFEKFALRTSDAIIAICPHLGDYARKFEPERKIFVIENSPEADDLMPGYENPSRNGIDREALQGKSIILYAGTFEHYQGLDLLIRSIPIVTKSRPDTLFLLVGGNAESIRECQRVCESLACTERVLFVEKVPATEVSKYIELSDVLVSPRKSGTNTPLKIYSYLRSGKPIVATNLITHTQVLNSDIAILTEPDPEAFARGILQAIERPDVNEMVQRARHTAEEKYSYEEYLAKTSRLYTYIDNIRSGRIQ